MIYKSMYVDTTPSTIGDQAVKRLEKTMDLNTAPSAAENHMNIILGFPVVLIESSYIFSR